MPQLDYDYDYLARYEANRKYNNSKRKLASESAQFNSKNDEVKYRKTSEKTKEQVRRYMLESSGVSLAKAQPKISLPLEDNKVKLKKESKRKTFDYESREPSFFELEKESRKNKTFDYEIERKTHYNESLKVKPEEIDLDDTKEAREERLAQKKLKMANRLRHFKYICLFAIAAAIALGICYRYSIINEKFNSVEKAKKELLNAQTINEQLQADIDSETDISYIENYAKYQLGMQKPQDSQIVYINVEKQDKIFTPINLEEEQDDDWFGDLMEKIASIF